MVVQCAAVSFFGIFAIYIKLNQMLDYIQRIGRLFSFAVLALLAAIACGVLLINSYNKDIPDYKQLSDYQPPVTTHFYAGDGELIADYSRENRLFVPISAIPPTIINAFLSAEDKNFYQHTGVDLTGLTRAILSNIRNLFTHRRPVGASTITQQVSRTFFLNNKVSIDRKIREAVLAMRIEKYFSKDQIFELYLNQIYLGDGTYGVAAAAKHYFNKSLDQLSIAQCAYLAALPKAPSNYNIRNNYDAAIIRRDWVIERMYIDGRISQIEQQIAKQTKLEMAEPGIADTTKADYFTEEVRRQVADIYGEKALYDGGLSIRTTLDPRLQSIADKIMRQNLIDYDRRHGWRGPLNHFAIPKDWQGFLLKYPIPRNLIVPGIKPWSIAIVLKTDKKNAYIGVAGGLEGQIPLTDMKWAKPALPDQKIGKAPSKPSDVLKIGDIIIVEYLSDNQYSLRQIPEVSGAMMVMDPHTGRVLAMVGGWSYKNSEFNRATQALRQPGSSFKPYVYAAAFENGLTPATIVRDAPFKMDQGPYLPQWIPHNYENDYMGPINLRTAFEHSRNLVTARLAYYIGMDKISDFAKRFGVYDNLSPFLANALGASETTLFRQVAGYAVFANGGKKITPTFIDRIQDRWGKNIFKHDKRACLGCIAEQWDGVSLPQLSDGRPNIIDGATAYQIVSLMQGVVERGTGSLVAAVGRPLAGKTGTTNDTKDAWFVGFSPDLVVGVMMGFDQPRTLGKFETGGLAAAPAFRDFMITALKDSPAIPFRVPPNINFVRRQISNKSFWEAFKPGTEPSGDELILDDGIDNMTNGF